MNDTVIQFRGTIYENGYGLIAQKVMRDKDLSPTAKSIYAYICSFSGMGKDGERTAFPGVALMKQELGIKTNGSYYKHRNQLIKKGYITIEKQRKEGQRFDNNLYFIEAIPVEKEEEKEPVSENQTTEPWSDLPTTVLPTTVKQTTNSTRSTSTSFYKEEEELKENPFYSELKRFLQDKKIKEKTISKTLMALKEKNVTEFSMVDAKEQLDHIMEKSQVERIWDFPTYFANGMEKLTEIKELKPVQQPKEKRDTSFYYDWLEA